MSLERDKIDKDRNCFLPNCLRSAISVGIVPVTFCPAARINKIHHNRIRLKINDNNPMFLSVFTYTMLF